MATTTTTSAKPHAAKILEGLRKALGANGPHRTFEFKNVDIDWDDDESDEFEGRNSFYVTSEMGEYFDEGRFISDFKTALREKLTTLGVTIFEKRKRGGGVEHEPRKPVPGDVVATIHTIDNKKINVDINVLSRQGAL